LYKAEGFTDSALSNSDRKRLGNQEIITPIREVKIYRDNEFQIIQQRYMADTYIQVEEEASLINVYLNSIKLVKIGAQAVVQTEKKSMK